MAGLRLSLFILASLAAVNADSCTKGSLPDILGISEIGNQLRSLPEGNKFQAALELVRDFFKTSPFPAVGYLDPLYIDTYLLAYADRNVFVDISETTITGLLAFEVTDIKTSLNYEKIQIDFLYPEISASGEYEILPTSQRADFYGDGEFVLTARNLRIQINVHMGKTLDGEMFCERMESELSVEAVDAKVTEFLDDEFASEALSMHLSEILPDYVRVMKEAFDEFLEEYTEYVNIKLNFRKFLKHRV